MADASDYRPPRWLRNAHLQSVLGSSGIRRRLGTRQLAALGPTTTAHLLDGGDGVRLQGLHSAVPGVEPRGLALLLHGWEGSVESSYMRLTTAQLLADGFEVFRLNFRDHGNTHHLNEDLFHSNRIDEVVSAAKDIARRFPLRPLLLAGYSLGGNFALRPARTMDAMEAGLPFYLWHFERKWRASLARKRALFPQRHDFDDRVLGLRMRPLTQWLIERHTDFGTLDRYFDGYTIGRDRLAGLEVPASILTTMDDPVIPFEDFGELRLPDSAQLEVSRWGGHCGFIENARLDGFAERWIADRLAHASGGGPSRVSTEDL